MRLSPTTTPALAAATSSVIYEKVRYIIKSVWTYATICVASMVFCAVVSINYMNACTGPVWLPPIIAIVVSFFVLDNNIYKIKDAWQTKKKHPRLHRLLEWIETEPNGLNLLLVNCSIVFIITTCIFWPGGIIPSQSSNPYVRVNGQVLSRPTFFNPFTIRDYAVMKKDQNRSLWTTAKTLDGVTVQAHIAADIAVGKDDTKWHWNDKRADTEVHEILKRNFAAALASRKAADIENTLALEFAVGEYAYLHALGLVWDGTLRVSDLHAYFKTE